MSFFPSSTSFNLGQSPWTDKNGLNGRIRHDKTPNLMLSMLVIFLLGGGQRHQLIYQGHGPKLVHIAVHQGVA